jgi:Zn-finger protein
VKDTTCLTCHESTGDHANPQDMAKSHPQVEGFDAALNQISEAFGRPVKRCSSCHVEHNTQAHIMPDDPHLCRDCHENLDQKLPQTKLSNVFDFGTSHPQFKPFIITKPDFEMPTIKRLSLDDDPKGFSGLKFPHDIHMSKTGAVAKMATTLETRYKFSGGVGCADCHRPEAGGALFEPVTMVQDCAMCHSIDFEDDNGYPRTLRHGEPQEVIASMKDFYDAKALANIRDAEMSTTTRRRPGQASQRRNLNRRELAFKQSEQRTLNKVNMIFSEGGSCYDCHVIDRPEDIKSLDFKVLPISVSDSFYTMSEFNHAAHEIGELTCQSCHSAETSQTSDDILLPKIDVCRDCHVSEEKFRAAEKLEEHAFPTNCLTCHVFHNAPHVKTIQGN